LSGCESANAKGQTVRKGILLRIIWARDIAASLAPNPHSGLGKSSGGKSTATNGANEKRRSELPEQNPKNEVDSDLQTRL
jgi:hypothetical protein